MVTIFANIRVNSEEALQHLKDSFYSFDTVSDNWLINIRGSFREETIDFLAKELGDRMIRFQLLDDSRGWIENALEMLPYAKYEYLLIWNEDHINTAPQDDLLNIVREMHECRADYLLYSWWMEGRAREAFDALTLKRGQHIDTINLTKGAWEEVRANGYPYYLLSLCGIYHISFFRKLLQKDRIKLPLSFTRNLYRCMTALNRLGFSFSQKKYFHIINALLFHTLRRYTKEAPFDLEKAADRIDMLPFRLALPKRELFACIDDDLDVPGYQLIKRGLYPLSFSLKADKIVGEDVKVLGSGDEDGASLILLSKEERYRRSCYIDSVRSRLIEEKIVVIKGKLRVETRGMHVVLSAHEKASVYPNVGYVLTALEDVECKLISTFPDGSNIHYVGDQGIFK